MRPVNCVVCRAEIDDDERFILLWSGRREAYCSESCLVEKTRKRARARDRIRRRWLLRALLGVLAIGGAKSLWQHFHAPPPQSISFEPPPQVPAAAPAPPRPEPPFYGPAWPPTDEDWQWAFAKSAWSYPLPGPERRAPATCDRILAGPEPPAHRGRDPAGRRHHEAAPVGPPVCRAPGRCGVDLGGELWGEQVYAVHDGVVDRVQHSVPDEPGAVYLRISHFGGMAFTHYFHLAAVPRNIVRGATVRAGEVVGLVGETGTEHPGRYIHLALSIRPSTDFAEVYWDPAPLMTDWPLHLPPHGTVAGFLPPPVDLNPSPSHRRTR
jgi:hypothetical protein